MMASSGNRSQSLMVARSVDYSCSEDGSEELGFTTSPRNVNGCYATSMSRPAAMARIRMMSIKPTEQDEIKSPVSPLQFVNEDLSASSYHRSSSFTSSVHASSGMSDEDTSSPTRACRSSPHPHPHYHLLDVLEDNQVLTDSLVKSRHVSDGLHALGVKVSTISTKIFDGSIMSFHANSNRITGLIDRALSQAAEFVKVYDAEHDVRRAVGAGPEGIDAQSYVQYVELLEDIIAVPRASSKLSITLHILQDSIEELSRSSLPDRLWVARLNRIVSSLRKMCVCFGEERSRDLELLESASQHLLRLWRTILTEYGMITPLPAAIPSSTENVGRLPPPPPPLSPHLVLALRDIVQNLASKGKAAVCMETYKDIRSTKALDSLQTLCPDYLRLCTIQASFHMLNWVDLKNHIQLWRQHLEVLTNILLTVEYELCRQVFSSSLSGPVWKQCFAELAVQTGLQSFLSFGEAVARSKNDSPEKLFSLLDMVAVIQGVKSTLRELLTDEIMGSSKISKKLESAELLLVRAVAKSFKDFKFQVDMQGPENVPLDGGVLQLSTTILASLCKLLAVESYEITIRRAVKLQQNSEKRQNAADLELSSVFQHILTSLEHHISDAASATHMTSKGQAFHSLFLMNNYHYIHVLLSQNEKLSSLLGKHGCLERYKEKANMYANRYQRDAWSVMLEYLGTQRNEEMIAKFAQESEHNGIFPEGKNADGGRQPKGGVGGGSRALMLRSQSVHGGRRSNGSSKQNQKAHASFHGTSGRRGSSMRGDPAGLHQHEVHFTLELQRVRAFQIAFEGVYQQHKRWSIPDAELKQNLGEAVLNLVIPAYETYLKSLLPLASSYKNGKAQVQQLKYSVPMIEKMIKNIFQIGA